MKNEEKIVILMGFIFILHLLAGSWILCCGLTKLITLLLGTVFYWYVGTIVWAIIVIIFVARNGTLFKE